jgi:uncharacterized protein YecE (DUF72 family)
VKERGRIRIGTAGWSIPKESSGLFEPGPSQLARYGSRFFAVEINSSFYRPHRPSTYARWARSVPEGFRFAVKIPKEITHERRLLDAIPPLQRFLAEAGALAEKLGPLLVQLPPSLPFRQETALGFFHALRDRFDGDVACEPRHASWFTEDVDGRLAELRIARVVADPARLPEAQEPGGWPELAYFRLHGSPRIYYSPYPPDFLDDLATRLREQAARAETWCIFDNTALGAATGDALGTLDRLGA